MYILQSLKDFIDNPMGKGSNAITSRQLIRDDLNQRYDRLIKEKKIEMHIYQIDNFYAFHLKIPSESMLQRNTYDVVILFTPGEDGEYKDDGILNRYPIQLFSNSPGFTYTYAYAYKLYGTLIDPLMNKYQKAIFDNPPVTRNPGGIINYEKTTYFAARHLILNNEYLRKDFIKSKVKKASFQALNRLIKNTSKVKLEIDTEKMRIKREEDQVKSREADRQARRDKPNTKSTKQARIKKTNVIKAHGKVKPRKSSVNKVKPK